ncbi:hypothetical protein [Amycolatopsis taiwanensis]|uniref:hypothetical protein n=1 Tax=Amycolatopsis taiwanensis TaxID=342230 RepID=UPI00048746CF|nr:hypothetical protein [Amycolatopsis taiwanensis]
MAIHLHTTEPPGGRPITAQELYNACWRGELPAEVLRAADRERLVEDLWDQGWTDVEIATHTRMTTYTTARIRTRLRLAPHHAQKEAAA